MFLLVMLWKRHCNASFNSSFSLPLACFWDCMWLWIVLLFRPSSSGQAEQKSFPPEAFNCSLGNSFTQLLGSIPLGSDADFPCDRRLLAGGGLVFVFRFLKISASVGDFSLSRRDTTAPEGLLNWSLGWSLSKPITLPLLLGSWLHSWLLLLELQGPESGAAIFSTSQLHIFPYFSGYSGIMLLLFQHPLFRKLCPHNSRIPSSLKSYTNFKNRARVQKQQRVQCKATAKSTVYTKKVKVKEVSIVHIREVLCRSLRSIR